MSVPEETATVQEASQPDAERAATNEQAESDGTSELDPWRHISSEALDQYYALQPSSAADAAAALARALGLELYISDTRESVRVSLAMQVLDFAGRLHLPRIKAAALLTISQTLLQTAADCTELEASKQVLKDHLIPLTRANSKSDEVSFLPAEIGAIAKFFAEGFFAHYRLYTFVYTQEQGMEDNQISMILEIPHSQPFCGQVVFTEEEWEARNIKALEKEEADRKAEEQRVQDEEAAVEEARKEQEKRQAELNRELELIRKPATLEEAIEKAVRWRVEKERKALEEGYRAEIAQLKQQLAAPPPTKK